MSKKSSGGLGVLDVILIVQIILKLFGLINWSWWAVLWPLWFIIIAVIIMTIAIMLD